jgi:arylsulfatase A-like enzyme
MHAMQLLRIGCLALAALLAAPPGVAAFEETAPSETENEPTLRPGRRSSEASAPDVLLVTIDTLRHDHLSFAGHHRETAPFLARLAAEGTVFTRAYSTSSWTVPAIASMLTGVYPTSHGTVHGVVENDRVVGQEVLPEGLASLAPELRGVGYASFAVVANGHLEEDFGFARGFESYRCVGFAPAEVVHRTVLEMADAIADARQPVFLWLHYFDPHQPYHPREPWLSRFQPDLTPEERALIERTRQLEQARHLILRGGARQLELARALYDSEIAYCDDFIRRLFEELPFLDSFLVAISSDHGEEFLEHGRLGHGLNLFEETIRVPLVVRPPGGGPGRRSDAPVSLVDVPPTLLTVAGGTTCPSWQGHPVFTSSGKPLEGVERRLLAELERAEANSWIASIGPRFKLIYDRNHLGARLFDLLRDPSEQRDLGVDDRPRLEMLVARLHGQMAELPPPAAAVEAVDLSDDQEDALRALGYLD